MEGADLLRAAFVEDATAVAAWRRWRDIFDWEAPIPPEEFRLLPHIARNLSRQNVDDPLLPRLQGVTRQAWYANQRRLRSLQPTLQALAAGGELLIVPPTAVLVEDATAVAPHAFACAVRGAQAEAAIRCLERAGWRTWMRWPRWSLAGYVLGAERLAWHRADGRALELSWQWDETDPHGRFPATVWARARRGQLANVPVLTLEMADAVPDLCRHSPGDNTFACAIDLLLCLTSGTAPPDWRRLLARLAETPVDPAWRDILAGVQTAAPSIVPESVIHDWLSAPLLPPAPPSGTMRERVVAHWSTYRLRWGNDYSFARAVRHLPGYLAARWGVPALARLPGRAWRGLRWDWRDAHRSR